MPVLQDDEIERIRSVIVRVAHTIDRKDWRSLRALYEGEVDVDYTSLFGGQAQQQRGDDLVDGWHQALATVTTQHLLGPIDVELSGSAATAECHVRAWHHVAGAPSGDTWVVGGHYVFALAKASDSWRITRMKLETFQQTGNAKLLQEASAMKSG